MIGTIILSIVAIIALILALVCLGFVGVSVFMDGDVIDKLFGIVLLVVIGGFIIGAFLYTLGI